MSAWPMFSLSGEVIWRPVQIVGYWARVEFWLQVIDAEEDVTVWRAFCNIDHEDLRGKDGAVGYVTRYVSDKFQEMLGPISMQKVLKSIPEFVGKIDFAKILPPEIPKTTHTYVQ